MGNLYVYHKPNQMQGHRYTDDVAICKAENKEEAIKIFSKMYKDVADCIEEVIFNDYGVYIATDY